MKRLPNFISCLRIALSASLLFLTDKPVLFAIVYFLCGVSDVVDGYLARLLGAETALGVWLDSIGDLVFFAVWLFIYLTLISVENRGLVIACIAAVALMRVANLMIAKVKFKHWGVLHTIGNKLTGFALFLMLPVQILTGGEPHWSTILIGAVAALSALEECVILIKSKTYDANEPTCLRRPLH